MGDNYDRLVSALVGFADSARSRGTPAMEAMNKMKTLLQRHLRQNNYSYLRTVFFPEFSKGARYPNRFPVNSNTFSTKQSFVLPASSYGVFACVIRPAVITPNSAFLYLFNKADTSNWGNGIPFAGNGQYIGNEPVKEFVRDLDTNVLVSPRLYFEKTRLIGCSVTINAVTPTNALYIGGVSYDTPIIEIEKAASDEFTPKDTIVNSSYFIAEAYSHALEMRVLAALMNPGWYPEETVPDDDLFGFPREQDAEEHTLDRYPYQHMARHIFRTIYTAGVVSANNVTFKELLQLVLRQDINNAAGVRPTWIERVLYGSQFKSEDSILREVEQNVRKGRPTQFELVLRLLKICKQGYFGFPPDDKPGVYTDERSDSTPRGPGARTEQDTEQEYGVKVFDTTAQLFNIAYDYSRRWTFGHSENLAKMLKDVTSGFKSKIASNQFPGSALNYMKIKDNCQYYHETKGVDGIRVVYVPNKDPSWNSDMENDTIYLCAQGLSENAKIQISVVRHFEGVGNPGVKEIFPGRKELPDLQSIDMVSNIFTLYPSLIHIPAARVEEYYRAMKTQFKWFDMVLYERGGVMEVERPLSIPSNSMIKVRETDEMPGLAE